MKMKMKMKMKTQTKKKMNMFVQGVCLEQILPRGSSGSKIRPPLGSQPRGAVGKLRFPEGRPSRMWCHPTAPRGWLPGGFALDAGGWDTR